MPRVMTIWLPRWPVQRRILERPELRRVPVFVCRRGRRGLMSVVSWAWAVPPAVARPRGGRTALPAIAPGASLAEAMAVLAREYGSRACRAAAIEPDDPAADLVALRQLARWCRRFSPTVGIDDDPAECVRLDVTGTSGFFGGEESLAHAAAWTLAARGLHARVGIADTPAASWAAARHTDLVAVGPPARAGSRARRHAVVPRGDVTALAPLPVAALRLEDTTLAALREVAIDTVGGVLRLSARSLASRFPPELSRRRAEFTGTRAEPAAPCRGPGLDDLPRAALEFDVPLPADAADMLVAALERLVAACVAPLAARGEGALALQVRLDHGAAAASWRPHVPPTVIDVGLFRPSAAVRHLVELVRLRLERMRLQPERMRLQPERMRLQPERMRLQPERIGRAAGRPAVEGVAVEVLSAGAATCRQRLLFDAGAGGADDATELGMLLDRLSGRLGRGAVFVPRPVADPQPEHAWVAAPPAVGSRPRGEAPRGGGGGAVGRPAWLCPRPVRLETPHDGVVAVAPDGPLVRFRHGGRLHTVVRSHGPERIETAWWRGPTVRRDYSVVETESGERFWVFRRLRDGAWFLHGAFA